MKPVRALSSLTMTVLLILAPVHPTSAEDEKTFLVRPFTRTNWFDANLDADEDSIEYVPNPTVHYGAKIGYKKMKVSFSLGLSHLEDEDTYGKTTGFGAEISYPFRLLDRELFATAFLYSQENLSTLSADGRRYPIEGMDSRDGGVDLMFFLNRDFSLDVILDELTPRSGNRGSWFLRSSFGLMSLGFIDESGDRVFIPPDRAATVGDLADLNLIRSAYGSFSGGYAFDWNFRPSLFFTAMGSLGMTVSRLDLSYASGRDEIDWTIGPAVSVLLGLTYAGRTFHAGAAVNVNVESSSVGEVLIEGSRASSLLFFGFRF